MATTKIKVPNKKGPIEYPKDHQPGMRVTKPGSSCSNCEYVQGDRCTNEYFQKWMGSDKIPAPIDEYCSDWWHSQEKE